VALVIRACPVSAFGVASVMCERHGDSRLHVGQTAMVNRYSATHVKTKFMPTVVRSSPLTIWFDSVSELR